jgi:hypothetical protein
MQRPSQAAPNRVRLGAFSAWVPAGTSDGGALSPHPFCFRGSGTHNQPHEPEEMNTPNQSATPDQKSENPPSSDSKPKKGRNQKKLAAWVAVLVLAGFILNSIFNPTPDEKSNDTEKAPDSAKSTSEAYRNGENYGLTVAENFRADGHPLNPFNDAAAEQVRVRVTTNQFDAQKKDWIDGFKAGYDHGVNSSEAITKTEWRAKLRRHFGKYAEIGVLAGFNADNFKKLMGEPSKTQSVGQSAYWYYDCSDGTIQLELNSGALVAGLMQGKINDF